MTCPPSPFPVGVALPTFPAVASVVGVFGCVFMPSATGSASFRLPSTVDFLGHWFQMIRVTTQDLKAILQVVKNQAFRYGTPKVLPHHSMRELVPTSCLDLAVPGTTNSASPEPMLAVVPDLGQHSKGGRCAGVDSRHTCIVHTSRAARHALFTAVAEGNIHDPLSRKARRAEA